MKGLPFFIVLLILVGGVLGGVQRLNTTDDALLAPTPERATVTPRPRPTSPLLATSAPVNTPTQAAAATATPEAPAALSQQSAPAATATPQVSGQTLRVGNTDGIGVFLRRTPDLNDKLRPWMDGTMVELVGSPVSAGGLTWQHVRAPDGVEGYIPSQYLVGGSLPPGTLPGPPPSGPRTRD